MGVWSCAACTFLNEDDALASCQVCHAVRVVRCAKCRLEIKCVHSLSYGVSVYRWTAHTLCTCFFQQQHRHGSRLRVAGQVFHPDCFVCTACAKPFPTPKFSMKDGDPYHSACLPTAPEVLCAQCFKTIGCVVWTGCSTCTRGFAVCSQPWGYVAVCALKGAALA